MKMKYKLYIVIFMVMCILPFAGMAVAKTETTTENRTMAAFPSFMEEGKWNVNYLQDLEHTLKIIMRLEIFWFP